MLMTAAGLSLGAACAAGESRGAQEPPARGASDRAADAPAGDGPNLTQDSTVDEILDALDAAGADLQSLEAAVLLKEMDNDTGDVTARPGKIVLARQSDDVRFRASFAGVLVNPQKPSEGLRSERIEYLLRDGQLIDRNYHTRTEVTRKLPPSDGKRDLLKLGEGPFPLPIGQSRQEVQRQFEVAEVDPADDSQNEMGIDAPEGTRRLRLTPKANTDLADDFRWLEVDVRLDTGMPAQVITMSATGSNTQVVDLRNVKLNVPVPPEAFDLEAIDRGNWNVQYEDLSEGAGSE